MTKLFVSFLGTSRYVPCNYGIDTCWYERSVQFVQTATLHLQCADWGPDDRVIIGCTQGAREANFEALKTELRSTGWVIDPEEVPLPDGTSEEELWTIFQRLLDCIGEGDELVFDITHSFRSLPMLFTVLIQYLRRLVEHLGDFTRCAQYVRGQELAQLRFQSDIVEPLRRLRAGFLPPLEPVSKRLEETFAAFQDCDSANALRTVAWCIDHGLIQQGTTLLQEAIVDGWVRRCGDLLDDPTQAMSEGKGERWRRAFVSDLLAVLGQGIPPTDWKGSLKDHRNLAQACAARLPPNLVTEYGRLTKLRNDINHGGYVEPSRWNRLREGLEQGYQALSAGLPGADPTPAAVEASRRTYLLNTPILTAYGEFRFSGPVEPSEARQRLAGGFVSAIGHQAAADFLASLLGIDVPVNRVAVAMAPSDRALVLRLSERLPEGKVLTGEEMEAVSFELGWLERTG